MDARTPETWPRNVVTRQAGEEIVRQVKRRLRGFLQLDRWDIKNEEFGRNLTLQNPCWQDVVHNGQTYRKAGRYVVRAIREFFYACSQALGDEVTERKAASPMEGTSKEDHDSETMRLVRKSTELYQTGKITVVDFGHHILIVAPDTGRIWRLGPIEVPEDLKPVIENAFAYHIPEPRLQLPYTCNFGSLDDDRSFFPKKWLSSDTDRAQIVEANESALEDSKTFCGETWDATSKRISEYLEEADSRCSSDDENHSA